ncbi:hypothetical protein [Piscinibacter sp.]|uniref:hypothetical protein n=1 Tax=Piscinibacter sp. TaxID=1903157 RepID=UPI0039E396B4
MLPITPPTPTPRLAAAQPVRPTAVRPVLASRQTQVLKSSREPAQLSLFPRPSGAR